MVELGRVVITRTALGALSSQAVHAAIARHQVGDWGDVDEEDREANNRAIKDGDRILSVYRDGETKFWVLTEADRSATTVLLPEDY